MKKFIYSAFIPIFILVILFNSRNQAIGAFQSYSDVPPDSELGHQLNYLYALGIIDGYPDGTFKPDQPVNRAEMAKIVHQSISAFYGSIDFKYPISPVDIDSIKNDYRKKIRKKAIKSPCFKDIRIEDWFFNFVCYGKHDGYLQGYGHQPSNFIAYQQVTRAEAVKMLVTSLDVNRHFNTTSDDSPYVIPNEFWYTQIMKDAKNAGMITAEEEFLPHERIDRRQIADIVYKFFQALATSDNYADQFSRHKMVGLQGEGENAVKIVKQKIPERSSSQSPPTYSSNSTSSKYPDYKNSAIGFNLGEVFLTELTANEIAAIDQDFNIRFLDESNKQISRDNNFEFNPNSRETSNMIIYNALNTLKHQKFSEPLPFFTANDQTLYELVKQYTHTFNMRTDKCGIAFAGDGMVSLPTLYWDTKIWPDCRNLDPRQMVPYTGSLSLIVHEMSHNLPDSMSHVDCVDPIKQHRDLTLHDNGGFANDAIYNMWVYKYGLYDTPEEKKSSREYAIGQLNDTICESPPRHPDPRVQNLVNELLEIDLPPLSSAEMSKRNQLRKADREAYKKYIDPPKS